MFLFILCMDESFMDHIWKLEDKYNKTPFLDECGTCFLHSQISISLTHSVKGKRSNYFSVKRITQFGMEILYLFSRNSLLVTILDFCPSLCLFFLFVCFDTSLLLLFSFLFCFVLFIAFHASSHLFFSFISTCF